MYYRVINYLRVDVKGDRKRKKPPSPRYRKTPLPRTIDEMFVVMHVHAAVRIRRIYTHEPQDRAGRIVFLLYLSKNTQLTAGIRTLIPYPHT